MGETRIPQKPVTLSEKALKIVSFASFNSHSLSYFHNYNTLKFFDIVNIEACPFINYCFYRKSSSVFVERSKLASESYARNTRSSSKGLVFVPSYNTS